MLRSKLLEASFVVAAVTFSAGYAGAQEFTARLNGFNELGALNNETGAILSGGTGTLRLDLDQKTGMVTYTLTYANLSSQVLQSHIHFAKVHVPGNIVVFLCTNLMNNPAGTPTPPLCPNDATNSGTVTGTFMANSVIGVPSQNVPAGMFDAIADIITSHTGYVNVHTNNFKSGEIRGQIFPEERNHNQDQNHQ